MTDSFEDRYLDVLQNIEFAIVSMCNKSKILEIPITAASCDVLRNFALRDGFCHTLCAASRGECTRE